MTRTGFHLGFVYLQTNLRPTANEKSVPEWNRWDLGFPGRFFNMSKLYLLDDGFVVVLHSPQFLHTFAIYSAAEAKGLFKLVQSYTIFLPKPMWQASSNYQVTNSRDC